MGSDGQWRNRIVKRGRARIGDFKRNKFNPKHHPYTQEQAARAVLNRFGKLDEIIVYPSERNGGDWTIFDGHLRETLDSDEVWDIAYTDLTDDEADELVLYFDPLAAMARADAAKTAALMADLDTQERALREMLEEQARGLGFVFSGDGGEVTPQDEPEPRKTLAERFVVPPFSVLDARQGYWQERKRAWISLGIQSELGRGDLLLGDGANSVYTGASPWAGTRGGKRANAAPGGSLRDATSLGPDGKTVRGDGKGRPVKMALEVSGTIHREKPSADQARKRGLARCYGQDLMRGENPNFERSKAYKSQRRLAALQKTGSSRVQCMDDGSWQAEHAYDSRAKIATTGTSIFDPVLCELAYRWFCPPHGRVLDPFAGGSVRGIVAAVLGRRYVGIDLSERQVEANEGQAREILGEAQGIINTPDALTPIEKRGDIWFKRDDLFGVAGVRGGKVRTCWALAEGAEGLVTAGSRFSPQVNIVAHIARAKGMPCRVHTPTGELSPEVKMAQAMGAEVTQHKAGYNSVIIKRAKDDVAKLGWTEIPFGMECQEAVEQTRRQVANLPPDAKRLVVPVGSGMSLAGILWGLQDNNNDIPVLGVCVGADPEKRLDIYAPSNWRDMVDLVKSGSDYHTHAEMTEYEGLRLDSIYEAKALPFLQPGDCLWIVGIRQTEASKEHPAWVVGDSRHLPELVQGDFDFVFTCPPYFDLEIYSNDERDLSNAGDYDAFLAVYRDIIAKSIDRLKQDRFACIAVGDIRDKQGFYRNFVSDTIVAFQDAGAILYNEAILVMAIGSLPIRVSRQFEGYRKLGKTHQNVLVFCKGDPGAATEAVGAVEVGDGLTPRLVEQV